MSKCFECKRAIKKTQVFQGETRYYRAGKKRVCLRCDKEFTSYNDVRLCHGCHRHNADFDEDFIEVL